MTANLNFDAKKGRKVLGRGLASLLPEANKTRDPIIPNTYPREENKEHFLCPVDDLVPCSLQPRKIFNDTLLVELSESIKENGIIQPLIVRKRGDKFEIIAGERRWRASKILGIKEIPVILKDISDKMTLQTALVENIQRADLNCIEEAKAYNQLAEEYSMTQEEVAKKVGKERSSVTNYMRLLKLPDAVQQHLLDKKISMGHARALCSIENEEMIIQTSDKIINKNMSVREVEKLVNKLKKGDHHRKNNSEEGLYIFDSIEDKLRQVFQTKVQVKGKHEKGKFVIEYFSKDDFERIYSLLNRME